MKNLLAKAHIRYMLVMASVASFAFGVVGAAGATTDPTLTTATGQVTSYFTANFPVVVGVFVAVALVIWLLGKAVHWVGIRGRIR